MSEIIVSNDCKGKHNSYEANLFNEIKINSPTISGWGCVTYEFYGYGSTEDEARQNLQELLSQADVQQLKETNHE